MWGVPEGWQPDQDIEARGVVWPLEVSRAGGPGPRAHQHPPTPGLSLRPTWVHTRGRPERVRWVPPGCKPSPGGSHGAHSQRQTEGRKAGGRGWGRFPSLDLDALTLTSSAPLPRPHPSAADPLGAWSGAALGLRRQRGGQGDWLPRAGGRGGLGGRRIDMPVQASPTTSILYPLSLSLPPPPPR